MMRGWATTPSAVEQRLASALYLAGAARASVAVMDGERALARAIARRTGNVRALMILDHAERA